MDSESIAHEAEGTEENRLPTNNNFIHTQRVSASAFIWDLYIGSLIH